jgi:uncharacterized protein (DUF1778 family)
MKMEATEKPQATRHRIEIKVSQHEKDLIVRAAGLAKQGLSEFVRTAVERAAREQIAQREKTAKLHP